MKMTIESLRAIIEHYYQSHPNHDKFILGVDFDNTLCYSDYPFCGEETAVCKWLKKCQQSDLDFYTSIVTCRNFEQQSGQIAFDWLTSHGVRVDFFNENNPFLIEQLGECRKISCNLYIDDKNYNFNMGDFEE